MLASVSLASSSTQRIGDELMDPETAAPRKKQRTGASPCAHPDIWHPKQQMLDQYRAHATETLAKLETAESALCREDRHDDMLTLSAACASRSLEHPCETLVPACASISREQLFEAPAPAYRSGSSPTAASRGDISTGTPAPRGKALEPGSEPDASSEYMSEATTTEDEAPGAFTAQATAGLGFNAFSGLEVRARTARGRILPFTPPFLPTSPASVNSSRSRTIPSLHRRR
jgi:hypothetical protein